jgi:uncharacterized membrane protein YqgA involved in biofilm formation
MVIPVGSLVNAGAVALGAALGILAGNFIGGKLRDALFQTLGLCTFLIGLKMALFSGGDLFLIILSCVLGMAVGQVLDLAGRLARLGDALKRLLRSKNEKFTDGLVTTSLIACIGAMGIVGALEEGLGGSRATLFSKSILDFCMAMMMATVYGSGAMAAAAPLLVYQGGITILAGVLAPYLVGGVKATLVSTGGLMIVGIGANLLGLKPISLENLLPALGFAVVLGAWLG